MSPEDKTAIGEQAEVYRVGLDGVWGRPPRGWLPLRPNICSGSGTHSRAGLPLGNSIREQGLAPSANPHYFEREDPSHFAV